MSRIESDNPRVFEWPVDRTVILTLDLECDYGTAIQSNAYEAATHTPKLRRFLEKYDLPLSCFLQTEVLDQAPEAVEALEQASVPVDFHAHSHTHPHPERADFEYEIDASLERIMDRFSGNPVGYRFPDGAVPPDGYRLLADRELDFSASLFPSWRPGRFDNRDEPIVPHEPEPTLIELPFTPFSSRVRVPISVSYLKVLGRPSQALIGRRPPNVIVFDMHMHDLVTPSTIQSLPRPYRLLYRRNRDQGFAILERFVDDLRTQGYRFATISEVFTRLKVALEDIPANVARE